MAEKGTQDKEFVGTWDNDKIVDGFKNVEGQALSETADSPDKINGNIGSDEIRSGKGNDLAAGDMVGDEWAYVDGKWVYNPDALENSDMGANRAYDDVITTGSGDDVLLGNWGNDMLFAEEGDDTLNAGHGNDKAFAGLGDDLVNLEQGNDYAEGGMGNDTVNAGDGDDVVYGDLKGANILQAAEDGATSMSQLADSGVWTMTDTGGGATISQSAGTEPGETYTIAFELAANLAGGHPSGQVEVLWNGDVVGTVSTTSGVYEKHEIQVTSQGDEGELSFRAVEPESDVAYDFSGPVATYEKSVDIGGESVEVSAFAPGQSILYQVIDGHLKAFDVAATTYMDVGDPPGFKINAVGFNAEDDLICGVAKSNGVDAPGTPVKANDIVMIDASGSAFRVGEGHHGDYVGDFDDSGNLWTFHTSLNRVSVVDVDDLDAQGNPKITEYDLPDGLFSDRAYDLAFNSKDGNFYAVVSPRHNGQFGKVVKVDLSDIENGGAPNFEEVQITGTLYDQTMKYGMSKGAYGAVFLDGDENLYFGLNKGDHDLDSSTGVEGGIFKVNVDWAAGEAHAEFMAEAQTTNSNDGTVDPRSADAFSEIDADAAVLIRKPELVPLEGGNDDLRGGDGNDEMYGNAGDDILHGGTGDDTLSGDAGNDKINAGTGDDAVSGGIGDDKLRGQSGDDEISGGDGSDFIDGGSGADALSGGAGVDKLVGGIGSDTIEGGAGNDQIWGGHWSGDNSADTFVVSSGSGKDIIHDFETDHDQIDLSSYGLEFSDVEKTITDRGWATEIDLSQLNGGAPGDKLILKSVDADQLDETNFIL